MDFKSLIDKIDKLSVEEINTLYHDAYLNKKLKTDSQTIKKHFIKNALIKCENDYKNGKTYLTEEMKSNNYENVLNNFIPFRLVFYNTYKNNELENKIKRCETLHNFCLKLCTDLSIN